MKRSKQLVIVILFSFYTIGLKANYKSDIYTAFITSNMTKWKSVIDEMSLQNNKSYEFKLELLNYQYGYIAWCIGNKSEDLAEKYLLLAESNVEILEKASYRLSMVNAYKAAFYGFRIGLNVFKAPFLGSSSIECSKLAMKLDDKNPFGYLQYGNSQFYMPVVFGGSKTVALDYFKKAESLMELNKNQVKGDWNYLTLLTMIINTYVALKNTKLAISYCEKILKVEPNYLWIKNVLYPQLLKQRSQ